eukprot:jgi/Orpsp1_1/1174237/evm.model.c7180000049373.1
MARTVSTRKSLISNDFIYPDFKKCKIILFFLVFLEYLNILVLTICNAKLKLEMRISNLIIIYFFEFIGLIFVILDLNLLNK